MKIWILWMCSGMVALGAALPAGRYAQFKTFYTKNGSDPGPTYLVQEDFEGSNGAFPSTWTLQFGTLEYETNSPAVVGSFSLYANSSGGFVGGYTNFTATADVWYFGALQVTQLPSTQGEGAGLYNDARSIVAAFAIRDDGGVNVYSGSASQNTVGVLSVATTYYFWAHYISGTSFDVWFSNNISDRDALGGNYHVQLTTGVDSGSMTRFYLQAFRTGPSQIMAYDKVRVSASTIGNNPP